MKDFVNNRVKAYFGTGRLYCAEVVVKIIAEAGGRSPDDVVRMATGFCSGASRTCGQCGAVSGAIMGIGLFAGRTEPEGEYEPAYALVQEFLAAFEEKHGAINCHDLVGCDFRTEEGRDRFKREQLKDDCIEYATFAAQTALDLLREHDYLPDEAASVRSQLAPCGLFCGKCLAFADGPVQHAAQRLAATLGDNFSEYAKRFEFMHPVFGQYPVFREVLDFLKAGTCTGCREQGCLFAECKVPACAQEHGVTYCFECREFPCDQHGMPEGLAARWRANNEGMQKHGIAAWMGGCLDRERYP